MNFWRRGNWCAWHGAAAWWWFAPRRSTCSAAATPSLPANASASWDYSPARACGFCAVATATLCCCRWRCSNSACGSRSCANRRRAACTPWRPGWTGCSTRRWPWRPRGWARDMTCRPANRSCSSGRRCSERAASRFPLAERLLSGLQRRAVAARVARQDVRDAPRHCSGGRQSFLAAVSLPLDAAVDCYGAFVVETPPEGHPLHGSPPLVERAGDLSCPLLGLFGAEDQHPSPEHVAELEAALKAHGKTYEFHSYEAASHAFLQVDRPSYRPESAVDAWQHIWAWFGRYLLSSFDRRGVVSCALT